MFLQRESEIWLMAQLVLTDKGRRKLEAIVNAVQASLRTGLARETRRMRDRVVAYAPSEAEEARLLSAGVATDGNLSGVRVGTPEGDRFVRGGGMMSLRAAIAADPVRVEVDGDRVFASTGDPTSINARTGFFWNTRRRGLQGPTLPFNAALVQAFEDGGAVWVVTPRPGTRALEPEPGVITHRVVKTLPPYSMYRRGHAAQRAVAVQHLRQDVKQAARRVGMG